MISASYFPFVFPTSCNGHWGFSKILTVPETPLVFLSPTTY